MYLDVGDLSWLELHAQEKQHAQRTAWFPFIRSAPSHFLSYYIAPIARMILYANAHNGFGFVLLAALAAPHLAGADMVHVPFKGGAPSVQSVLAGDAQLTSPQRPQ